MLFWKLFHLKHNYGTHTWGCITLSLKDIYYLNTNEILGELSLNNYTFTSENNMTVIFTYEKTAVAMVTYYKLCLSEQK